MNPTEPVLDISSVSVFAAIDPDGSRGIARKVLLKFAEGLPDRVQALVEAADRRDPIAIQVAGHGLVSGALSVGARALHVRAAAIERAATDGNLTELVEQLAELQHCAAETRKAIIARFGGAGDF